MKKKPSPGEWQILLALWRLGKQATLDEVIQELGEQPAPPKGKIRTILLRLTEKRFVRSALKKHRASGPKVQGRPPSRYYWPAKEQEAATKDEIRRFLSVYLGDDKDAIGLLEEVVREKRARPRKKRTRRR